MNQDNCRDVLLCRRSHRINFHFAKITLKNEPNKSLKMFCCNCAFFSNDLPHKKNIVCEDIRNFLSLIFIDKR